MLDYYKCPTTGRIIAALPGDDKVLCYCGQSNPKCPYKETYPTHVLVYLVPATEEAYGAQNA